MFRQLLRKSHQSNTPAAKYKTYKNRRPVGSSAADALIFRFRLAWSLLAIFGQERDIVSGSPLIGIATLRQTSSLKMTRQTASNALTHRIRSTIGHSVPGGGSILKSSRITGGISSMVTCRLHS